MADLEAIKRRLARLTKMTTENGCSEGEALNAAALITQILEENGLSYSDIQTKQQQGRSNEDLEFGYFGDKKKIHEVSWCVSAIAEYFECKVFSRTMPNGIRTITFFGFAQDVAAAMTLTHAMMVAMESDYAIWVKTVQTNVHGKTLRTNFMRGFGFRIGERLKEMKAAAKAKVQTGTALVVLKNQIIATAMNDSGIKLRQTVSRSRTNADAEAAGRAAGNRANLSNNSQLSQSKKIGN